VPLIELNGWEDEWLVLIKALEEGKRNTNKVVKKEEEKDMI
jgi:hypothetical protein